MSISAVPKIAPEPAVSPVVAGLAGTVGGHIVARGNAWLHPPVAWCPRPCVRRVLAAVVVGLMVLVLLSGLANLSHPLMWADESMAAVGAERVLAFGYPKVHDGKNVFYDLQHPDRALGIDQTTDAFIGSSSWLQYYMLAPFASVIQYRHDPYERTFWLRLPFLVVGLLGLLCMAATVTQFLSSVEEKLAWSAAFGVLTLLNVSLILHLREVRYYSLLLFLYALLLFVFTRYQLRRSLSFRIYAVALPMILWGLLTTFLPAFFAALIACAAFIGIRHGWLLTSSARPAELTAALREGAVLGVAAVGSLPFLWFVRAFQISAELARFADFSFAGFIENLNTTIHYFGHSDLLWLALAVKAVSTTVFVALRRTALIYREWLTVSGWLWMAWILFVVVICRIPSFIFVRYLITPSALLAALLLLDASHLLKFLAAQSGRRALLRTALLGVLGLGVLQNIHANRDNLAGHWHELWHPYKGPLDFAIPFIQEKFPATDRLVIATNYEETSFMYYLHSKTTIGYVKNNLEADLQVQPDIIVVRRGWLSPQDLEIFAGFLRTAAYEQVAFPVMDYPVNNIPELHEEKMPLRHQFRTLSTSNPDLQLRIFIRVDSSQPLSDVGP